VWLLRPATSGGTRLPESIGPGKPASLISSSCIGKAVRRAAKASQEQARRDGASSVWELSLSNLAHGADF
jgi:hypothetical protein